MSQITRPVQSRFHPRFLLLLLVALVVAVGLVQRFGPFDRSAHASTTAAATRGNLVPSHVSDGSAALFKSDTPGKAKGLGRLALLAEDDVVINEFSVNATTGKEYVELLVVAAGGVDMRSWTISDVGTRAGAAGATEGDITLPNASYLSSVPQGTFVVIVGTQPAANSNTLTEDISTSDGNRQLVLIVGTTTGITTAGTFDIATNENLQLYAGTRAAGTLIDQVQSGTNGSYIAGTTWGDNSGGTTTDNIDGDNDGSNGATLMPSGSIAAFCPTADSLAEFQNNDTGSRFTVTPSSYGTPGARNTCVASDNSLTGDAAPSVSSTTPTDNATGVALNSNISVTFSEAVNAAAGAFAISCATSGAHTFALSGGPTTFTLDPDTDFVNSELCTVTVTAAQVTDQDANDPPDNMAADYVFHFTAAASQPTLNINDVTQAETNAGTTNFTFNVSLTLPAGASGVSFTVDTADGTTNPANAGSDYVAITGGSGSITSGNTSTTVTVQVNGDMTTEPNETFFVNITNVVGATAGDVQGLGTITNDDISATSIHTIQGSGATSPLAGNVVTTTGIVTGLRSNGFFLQEPSPDADPNTSEGIFVFTSSAPPAAAAIGNSVSVTGTVQEFIPGADTSSPPATEISGSPTVNLLSTGNPLPPPITITAADTLVNDLNNLEKYEFMRVHVDSLTVIAPTQGTVNELNATSATNGTFYGVITGVARPFREPGIELPDPIPTPTPNPNNIPRWDFNPERLRVDSDAQPGAVDIEASTGEVITNITGPLDYAFRTYTILPDASTPPTVPGPGSAVPVPTPTTRELTIATFNMQRFYNDVDDAGGDTLLTTTAYNNRLNKASLAIRNFMNAPDVIAVEEMENLSVLQAVATKVNNDAVAAAQPNPNYQAYLIEGNDIGLIDVGFLVKTPKITFVNLTQLELAGCDHTTATTCNNYIDPGTGNPAILNDRPPLVLQATVVQPSGVVLPFTVIAVHQRSLSAVDDPVDGNRVRTKRRAQAEFLANYIQSRQVGDPNESIVSLGDYNGFNVNDGYVDVMGTVKGTPAAVDQVLLASSDLVNPDLTDLGDLTPGSYSYTFDGDAQSLDHILANNNMRYRFSRLEPVHINSDFPDSYRNNPNRPERISDHDPEVAYFTMAIVPTADNGVVSGKITTADGSAVSGAVVTLTGAQSRKTITDAAGNYRFDNVETSDFYTVTPTRTNYMFSPANRSFSQLGNKTEAAFTGLATGDNANPLDTAEYFVRAQYLDLLGREPDESGFNYWSGQINQCGDDQRCVSDRRNDVAVAFFVEQEFQLTGSFIHGLYKGALGRSPVFNEYSADRQQVVGGANLETEKRSFADAFVERPEFVEKYQGKTSAESFVDALLQNVSTSSSLDLSSERANLIARYNVGASLDQSRSLAVRQLTESAAFRNAQYNSAFVLTEYFSYLRRDPDAGGNAFWLNVLDHGDPGNYRGMVCGFINSSEYQRRFSLIVTRSDGECSR